MEHLIFQNPLVNRTAQHKDQIGELVRGQFQKFLEFFDSEKGTSLADIDENDLIQDALQDHLVQQEIDPTKDYLVKLDIMRQNERTTLQINFQHIVQFDEELAGAIESQYYRFEPFLRKAIQGTIKRYFPNYVTDEETGDREFWVSFYNTTLIFKVRDMKTNLIGKLVTLRGTVTRTSEVRPELLYGSFQCLDCRSVESNIEQQFRYTEPTMCKNPACSNRSRWVLSLEHSKFADWQKIRLQENSDEIPSGSMPRSLDVIVRHEEVEKAKAGDKTFFTGTLIVVPDMTYARLPGPKLEGTKGVAAKGSEVSKESTVMMSSKECAYRLCFLASHVQSSDNDEEEDQHDLWYQQLTEEERHDIEEMKNHPKIYKKLVNSIAPTVFRHNDVKKGILLMLFGGIHKKTVDGINLRGDINVCIVGDPSTSKSQFLKYVVRFLPRAVYTSGKASTAAGLTASVVRDPDTGEFNIEAGALMLADNGICCIDEFDKMDTKDQVAIHEAMEQQTISMAKAGIYATLNARTSILAAANPIGGRYDKSKSLRANLDISAPIMSRFDLFFVVLDEMDESVDFNIARHIVKLHQQQDTALEPEYSTGQLQRYIRYAKSVQPKLTPEAAKLLVESYTKLRQGDILSHTRSAYRITVRQLESLIRLSEALARVHCDPEIGPEYVIEATQLLRKSIIHIETTDVVFERPNRSQSQSQSQSQPQSQSESQPVETLPESEGAKQGEKREKIRVSFEKFNKIQNMLARYLKHDIGESGVKQKQLIRWYLEQVEDELENPEQLEEETELIVQAVQRLITRDRVLYVLSESTSAEDRVLTLHPNFDFF